MQNDSNNKKSTNWYADKPELAAERNRRRNEKYKSDPNYQVKIKTQQRQRYRKDNEFISDKAVLENNLEERIATFGQKKLVYFGEELVECVTFKTTSLSDVLGITYPSMQSYFRLGMIPRTAIEKEIANLKTEIAMHDVADEGFKALAITVFQVASDAYDLFEYGTLSERRSLIDFVLSDITLTGKKLGYSLRCPFDIMAKMNHNEDWLPGQGSNLRPNN